MKRLNGYRMRLVAVGIVAVIVLFGKGSAKADFTFGEPIPLEATIAVSLHKKLVNTNTRKCASRPVKVPQLTEAKIKKRIQSGALDFY